MKSRNKNRIPNRSKFGSRMHSSAPQVISMTRVSFDDDGQCIGTEQVQAKVQLDPRNGCYHVMINDIATSGDFGDEPNISDHELEQLMATLESQSGARP
jgi:hypothetical protein